MKTIFTLCLAAAMAFAGTACSNDDDNNGDTKPEGGKLTLNGTTKELKSAFYDELVADETYGAEYDLYLFVDKFTTIPEEEPEFYFNIQISQSLLGQTIDLTKVLPKTGDKETYLWLGCQNIDAEWGTAGIPTGITSGALKVTRSEDGVFTVELKNFAADLGEEAGSITGSCTWNGKATLNENTAQ